MVFYFDITKAAGARHFSGLTRVSERLRHAIEKRWTGKFSPVIWNKKKLFFSQPGSRDPVHISSEDCFLTPEVFSSVERPGFYEGLKESRARCAAIFHDSIPLKHPDIIWPKSVERHPQYMEDLLEFNNVFSVSAASKEDLGNYWASLGKKETPPLRVLQLGADFFDHSNVKWRHRPVSPPLILCIGILEPRKNQQEVLKVACGLWEAGLQFELHFVGRVNPHFGKPIEKEIKAIRRKGYPIHLHSKQNDELLLDLYSKTRFTVFNSYAEGFGLPVIESLWLGIPCLCNDLPSLRGFLPQPACQIVSNENELTRALKSWLENPDLIDHATLCARKLTLPQWSDAAETLIQWAKD